MSPPERQVEVLTPRVQNVPLFGNRDIADKMKLK
jgi:hypothetical protein